MSLVRHAVDSLMSGFRGFYIALRSRSLTFYSIRNSLMHKKVVALWIILFLLTACSRVPVESTPVPPTAVGPTEAPSTIPPQTFTPQLTTYNLGESTILQDQFPEDSRFREMPVRLEGANHNHFNSVLEAERVEYPADRPDCTAETSLTAVDQQAFLSQYTIDFLQTIYGQPDQTKAARQRLGMEASTPPPTTYNAVAVRLNFLPATADKLAIIQPQSEAETSQNLLGGTVSLTGLTAQFCPDGYYVPAMVPDSEACKRVNFNQPGFPQQFVINWDSPDAEWRRMAIPESEADLTGATAVALRAALDPLSDLNGENEPQSLTLELVDGDGNMAQATTPSLDFPIGQRQPNEYFEGDSFSGHVYMNSVRIPLTEFGGIDLTNITEIALLFDQTSSGTLFIADLSLIKE